MIHTYTVIYGHCISLSGLYTNITGKTLIELKQEAELTHAHDIHPYTFDQEQELQDWYLIWCDRDLKGSGFETRQFSDAQCEDTGIPNHSIALGYKVASLDRFCPIFLRDCFSYPDPKAKYRDLVEKITDKRILDIIQFVQPQLLLVVDECDCC
jgi:hypothetical protein